MSESLALDGVPFDRRALLRAGLVGGAALAAAAAQATGATGLLERLSAEVGRLGASATPSGVAPTLPSAATWGALVGREVVLTGTGFARSAARVVDVSDVAHPSPHVTLRGDAYSVLFDASFLPAASSAVVTVHHESLDTPTLVLMPVNGDGSWEALVDRRTPVPSL